MRIGAVVICERRVPGVDRMARADEVHVWADHHVVADLYAAEVHRRAAVVYEHVAAEPQIAAAVGVERREHAYRRIQVPAGQLAEERAHGVEVAGRQRVETTKDFPGALDVGVHRPRVGGAGLSAYRARRRRHARAIR
jgi:hypothetical protein